MPRLISLPEFQIDNRERGPAPNSQEDQATAQAKTRLNDEIRGRQVRLIDENGEQKGIVETQDALDMARERGLDLVEVAPEARPPVCKILDYGKQKYLAKKKENEARKKQHQVVVKEVRVRPKIDTHDLSTKLRKAREFLEHGDKLQVNMLFRGREHGFRERGLGVMHKIKEELADLSKVEREPRLEGNRLVMILHPLNSK
ncbi:MAG: translation initiation factor IF-3 [Planctomycetota bacterium]|nr:MAG: translation initiation factor IF-3 [Planctomycetota bacterium]